MKLRASGSRLFQGPGAKMQSQKLPAAIGAIWKAFARVLAVQSKNCRAIG
jgi:hypothetical protein